MANKLFGNTGATAVSLDDLDNRVQEPVVEPTPDPEPEPIEEPKDAPAEPEDPQVDPQDVPADDPKDDPAAWEMNLEFFNKTYDTNFDSEDSLKQAIEGSSRATDLQKQVETYEAELSTLKEQTKEYQEKLDILLDQTDPLSHFSSPEAYKLEQYKKQFPEKDPATAQRIFSTEDFDKVDDMEIVKWGYRLEYPRLKGGEAGLEATIRKDFGIDSEEPFDELDVSAQNAVYKKADEYRRSFKEMTNIPAPSKIDIEAMRNERNVQSEERKVLLDEGWAKESSKLADNATTMKIPIGEAKEGEDQEYFEWNLDTPVREEVDSVVSQLKAQGIEANEESVEMAKAAVQVAKLQEVLPKIMAQYKKDLLNQWKEQSLKELHNADPIKDTIRKGEDPNKKLKEMTDYALEGLQKFKRPSLFNTNK